VAYAAEGRAAVVVLGEDPVAAALVALGIAREHARRRRVAVADLVGEVEPLQALVTGDDPHGVVDSFLYGVSLNKIARQVEDGSNLFVMPSGTEPVLTEDIFRNARWRRLASGFREMGALLLLVAPLSAAGVDALVDAMDGAIVVGEPQASPILPDRVLASVREPRRTPRLSPVRGVDRVQRTAPPPPPSGDDGRGWILPTIAAAIVLAAVGFFLTRTATRQLRRTAAAPVVAARDTAPAPASAQPAPSAAPADTVAPADPLAPLVLANPADSAQASAYGVLVVTTNTPEGASLRLRQGGAGFPAATVAPVTLGSDGSRWFQVVAGAYPAPQPIRCSRACAPGASSRPPRGGWCGRPTRCSSSGACRATRRRRWPAATPGADCPCTRCCSRTARPACTRARSRRPTRRRCSRPPCARRGSSQRWCTEWGELSSCV
jgi:hypothetical protein